MHACLHSLSVPLKCHSGRQDISAVSYFQNAHRTTVSQSFFFFYKQCADRSRARQWDRVPVFNQQNQKRHGSRRGPPAHGRSLAHLMRGTLSNVQQNDGPLCKCRSSSQDWLYNLQQKTFNIR